MRTRSLVVAGVLISSALAGSWAGKRAWSNDADILTPQQRIDGAWEAMRSFPWGIRTIDSVAPKGSVPSNVQPVEKCTKKWCDPHPKNVPFPRIQEERSNETWPPKLENRGGQNDRRRVVV